MYVLNTYVQIAILYGHVCYRILWLWLRRGSNFRLAQDSVELILLTTPTISEHSPVAGRSSLVAPDGLADLLSDSLKKAQPRL